MLFSLSPFSILLYPFIMFVTTILIANILFTSSNSIHTSFTTSFPLLYLSRSLNTLTITAFIISSTDPLVFSPPTVQVNRFIPINYNNLVIVIVVLICYLLKVPITTTNTTSSAAIYCFSSLFILNLTFLLIYLSVLIVVR